MVRCTQLAMLWKCRSAMECRQLLVKAVENGTSVAQAAKEAGSVQVAIATAQQSQPHHTHFCRAVVRRGSRLPNRSLFTDAAGGLRSRRIPTSLLQIIFHYSEETLSFSAFPNPSSRSIVDCAIWPPSDRRTSIHQTPGADLPPSVTAPVLMALAPYTSTDFRARR